MPRTVILTYRRHPHEVMLLALCLVQGLAYAIGQPRPGSVVALLPPALAAAWFWMLLAAGAVGLVGNLWPGHVTTALRVRLAGMLLAASPAAAYGITLIAFVGSRGSFAAGIVFAWAAACLWRAGQLAVDLRQIGVPR